jgi:uncharacterized phage protein gp47/JayE
MALDNSWIGYVTRSYEQIKSNVLTKFQALVPEMTDHTENNLWVRLISIWAGAVEMLGYYIDRRAREAFLSSAIKFDSGVKIARMFGYRIKGSTSASVDLVFTTNVVATAQINIPEGSIVQTAEGVTFLTTQLAIIPIGQDTVQVGAIQHSLVVNQTLGTSDGTPEQRFELIDGVVDSSITIAVGLANWTPVESFSYSVPDSEDFVCGQNDSGFMEVQFSDGMAGKIPTAASDVVANYSTTLGDVGNVGVGFINEIVSSIVLPASTELSVTNPLASSGGANKEELSDIKQNIPLTLRTKDRAVTEQDFIDIANLVAGVSKSGVDYTCGGTVDIYIVPDGGGVPSNQLIQDVTDYFEPRRIITVKVQVIGAGEVVIKISADIRALPNYSNADVRQRVEDNLILFLSSDNQDIRGTVYLGDIYEVIENTQGVSNSDVNLLGAEPFARGLFGTVNVLTWDVKTSQSSNTTNQWRVRFTSATDYELKRNGSFIGNYSIGNSVSLSDISFSIYGSYTINDEYEFYSYPYDNRKIELSEPSVPVTNAGALSLTVSGGI